MRYSIVGSPVDKVYEVGATNVKYKPATKIIFADLDEQQVSRLRVMGYAVERVTAIRPSSVSPPLQVESVAEYSPSQLLDMVGIDSIRRLSAIPLHGQGYNVAILDSGIRETHEVLRGRVIYSKNFTSDPIEDKLNHGTGVASVLAATVPLSGILNMKVLNDGSEGSSESAVDAIEECLDLCDHLPIMAPSVINLSVGAPDYGNPNEVLRVACRAAVERGIWVVAAAGNSGPEPNTVLTPACDGLVIAVGSLSPYLLSVSDFSSRGPTDEGLIKPDFMMFGEDLEVASSEGDKEVVARTGTSFAAPFVAGLCILCYDALVSRKILGNHAYSSDEIEVAIEGYFPQFCMKPEQTSTGKDNDYGHGVLTGSYVAQAIENGRRTAEAVAPAIPIGGLLTVSMMGMMMRMIKV